MSAAGVCGEWSVCTAQRSMAAVFGCILSYTQLDADLAGLQAV